MQDTTYPYPTAIADYLRNAKPSRLACCSDRVSNSLHSIGEPAHRFGPALLKALDRRGFGRSFELAIQAALVAIELHNPPVIVDGENRNYVVGTIDIATQVRPTRTLVNDFMEQREIKVCTLATYLRKMARGLERSEELRLARLQSIGSGSGRRSSHSTATILKSFELMIADPVRAKPKGVA